MGSIAPFDWSGPAQKSGAKLTQEQKRTEHLALCLPRGITIGERHDGRDKPYYVRSGRHRHLESFATEKGRNDWAAKLGKLQEEEGRVALDVDPVQWRAYQSFLKRSGADLAGLEALWDSRKGLPEGNLLTRDAAPRYIALRVAEGMVVDSDTHRHVVLHLGRFVEKLGFVPINDLTPTQIREWIDGPVDPLTGEHDVKRGLGDPETGLPMGKVTKRNHRKDVNTFLKRAVEEEWAKKNPCAKVRPPKILQKNRPPMPVKDIFQLLKANRDLPVIGRIALELFGSLRCSSAARCEPEWIKWEAHAIRMPGADEEAEDQLHKSGKTLYRQGHPPLLWDWLKHAAPACWTEVPEGSYGFRKGQAFTRANVKNPGNGLRRSCASYQLAVTKNVGPVSYLMQHKHTSTTLIYEGEADESAGHLFMAMTPDEVLLTWEEFVQKHQPPKAPAQK